MQVRRATTGVALAVAALTILVAGTAYAAVKANLTLKADVTKGRYGQEVALSPELNTTIYPGDKVALEVYQADGTWAQFGEPQSAEETITAVHNVAAFDPMYMFIDESLSYPAVLRASYTPKGSINTTDTSDQLIVLNAIRNTKTKVAIGGRLWPAANKTFTTTYTVSPNSGIGNVTVTIKGVSKGSKYKKTFTVVTNEEGFGDLSLKLPRGNYTVSAKFAGNRFGAASPAKTATIHVR